MTDFISALIGNQPQRQLDVLAQAARAAIQSNIDQAHIDELQESLRIAQEVAGAPMSAHMQTQSFRDQMRAQSAEAHRQAMESGIVFGSPGMTTRTVPRRPVEAIPNEQRPEPVPTCSHWMDGDFKMVSLPLTALEDCIGYTFWVCPPHKWRVVKSSEVVQRLQLKFVTWVVGDCAEIWQNAELLMGALKNYAKLNENGVGASKVDKQKQVSGRRLNLEHLTGIREDVGDSLHGEG